MYRDKLTGQRRSKPELIASHPNISLPAEWDDSVLDPLGVDYVKPVARPEITATQRIVEGPDEEREDGWYQTWVVQDLSAEEVAGLVAEAKAAAVSRLQAEKWARMLGTFRDSHGHLYAVDSDSRALLTGKVAMLGATARPLPAGFVWKTAEVGPDGKAIYVPHDAETLLALSIEIEDWTDAVFRASEAGQAAVIGAGDLDGIKAAEAGVGWP